MVSLTKSKQFFNRISRCVPGGVHSNFRSFIPHPLYFAKGKGSRLWDVDGNEYIDFVVNYGANILGHHIPEIIEAVKRSLDKGLTTGTETELSIEVSEKLKNLILFAESVKFSNTGTEAVMKAIMIARGYTNKQKIAKVEGCYNGWYDCVAVSDTGTDLKLAGSESEPNSIASTAGILDCAVENTIIIPYNNLGAAEKIIKKNKHDLAAFIVEPIAFNMGCVLPKEGYLEGVREITEDNDVLLIFDEIITGFRVAKGGAQEYYGVQPDLSTFAKAIANGFPLSAVTGREDVISITEPGGKVSYAGTYNANQMSLAAASATLNILSQEDVQGHLSRITDNLVSGFNDIVEDVHQTARLQGFAGQFQVYFTDEEVIDFRTAARSDEKKFIAFQQNLLQKNILFLPRTLFHHGMTFSHTENDIDLILKAMEESLKDI